MTLRDTFGACIPALHTVEFVTDADLADNINRGAWHRFIIAWDVAYGVWGGPEPCTTISSRCAHTLLEHQLARPHTWMHTAPMWALALGAALEKIDPGHLQGAMLADVARQAGGILYLTGVRVLAPLNQGV